MPDTLSRDLRLGLRVLIKERAFTALAITVLALGISGVTTMFSVVNGVMLRGFDFPNADRLASANFIDPTTATAQGVNGRITAMDFEELLPHQQSFELMAAYLNGSTVNMTIDGQPRRYTGAYITENFLRILGVAPIDGRDFRAEDNQPGAERVAIIGHGLWQRDFGGAPDTVGRTVRINGRPASIIGIMPPGFAFPTNEELWLPLYGEFPPRPRTDNAIAPAVLGLLKLGVSPDQATAEFTQLAARFAREYPDSNKQFNAGLVEPLIVSFTPRQLRGTLLTMLAFCVGVLLIACANVMNMQFARATLRAKELAVRSSLGASRTRLIRQMLTESALLSAIGGVFGVALAYGANAWLTRTVRSLEQPPPAWITFDIDPAVLAITLASAAGAAILSGLLPALGSSRVSAVDVLRDAGRGNTSRRMNFMTRGLVVFQIVVTCVLLIGAMLQLRSITAQQQIDFGYDTGSILTARMGLMEGDYPTFTERRVFYDRLLQTLNENSSYAAVALTNRFRMLFSGAGPIEIDGRAYAEPRDRPQANFEQVTPGYFDVTGQRMLDGRTFTASELQDLMPVAIVNAAFARKHFGAESALNRRFRTVGPANQPGPWRTIVGVVSDVRMIGPFNNPNVDESGFYVPFYSNPFGPLTPAAGDGRFATLIVKPRSGPPEALTQGMWRDVMRVDPHLPLYFVGTPQSQVNSVIAQNGIIATMFGIFGVVAVVLAAVGIYGLMSFSVNQRRQEFGVRMALGADRRRILAMVLRQSGVQVAIGALLGAGLALALASIDGGRPIQSVLFGVDPRDPRVYLAVIGLVAVVAAVASFVPARRATRVDPMIALRAD